MKPKVVLAKVDPKESLSLKLFWNQLFFKSFTCLFEIEQINYKIIDT
jgi:hypothetical protein